MLKKCKVGKVIEDITLLLCYYKNGDSMKLNNNLIAEEFEDKEIYKLYRTIKEIIRPTISKKNISNYKIIMQDNMSPIRVFYPEKVTKIEKASIYIHGNGYITGYRKSYAQICSDIAKLTNSMVIAIDYELTKEFNYNNFIEKLAKETKWIINELYQENLNDIYIIGDSLGANFILAMNQDIEDLITKQILITPIISWDYDKSSQYKSIIENSKIFQDFLNKLNNLKAYCFQDKSKNLNIKNINTNTLIITGNADLLRDEGKELSENLKNSEYRNINFADHSLLLSTDKEIKDEINITIKDYINKLSN